MRETIEKHSSKILMCICLLFFILANVFNFFYSDIVRLHNIDSTSTTSYHGYIPIAQNLLKSGFFSQDGILPDYFRTPGYPLFLALIYGFGGNNTTVIIVQILLSTLSIYLAYDICMKMGAGKLLSLGCSILFLFDFHIYFYSNAILSDTVFVNSLIIALLFLARYYNSRQIREFAFFSISMNYALLVRPVLMYFSVFICIVLMLMQYYKKVKWSIVAWFISLFVIVFFGWSYRNYSTSGVFIYSDVRNYNLLRYDAAILYGYVNFNDDGILSDEEELMGRQAMDDLFLERNPLEYTASLNESQINQLRAEVGREYIRSHWPQYIVQNIKGLFTLLVGPNRSFISQIMHSGWTAKVVSILYAGFLMMVYLLYMVGVWLNRRHLNGIDLFIFLACGYLAAAGASLGMNRFRVAFFGLVIIGAASAWKKFEFAQLKFMNLGKLSNQIKGKRVKR